MKTNAVVLAAFSLVLASTLALPSYGQTLTSEALSADRVAIYHEFFATDPGLADASASSSLNVASTTEPFVYRNYVDPDRSCLSTAHIFDLATPRLHKLPATAFSSDHINLVDLYTPQPGHNAPVKTPVLFQHTSFGATPIERPASLITLSEIVFDETHTHAAFRYTYATGPDTGKGATALYVLSNNSWKPAASTCSEWTR